MARIVIDRSPSGALVHLRKVDTKECVGCIEAGLFDLVEHALRERMLEEFAEAAERHVPGGKEQRS